jgi:DNA-binding transcriptional MocR family regulator
MWTPRLSSEAKTKSEAIARAIAEDIAQGVLKPGTQLPTQRGLAKRLSVTIGTVGRAYALAEKRGLISLEIGRGSFVRTLEARERGGGQRHPVDLGLNLPPATEHPDLLARTLAQLSSSRHLSALFGSAPTESLEYHRVAAAKWLEERIACSSDDILICSGTQNALVCSLASLTKPGDKVLVEELTFPGMIAAARFLNLELVPVAMDEFGLVPSQLDRAAKKSGVLYCIPTNQNPTTASMPLSRRQEISRVAAKRGLVVVEDDVYGKLVDHAAVPIAALLPNQTFLISSLAKTMSVGLRIAYLRVPPSHRDKVIANMRATNFFPPPLMCEIAANWINDGTANRLLHELRETAGRRQHIAREVLAPLSFRGNPVGNHIWLNLPEDWPAEILVRAAIENGVRLYPAAAFSVEPAAVPNAVRLALGAAVDEGQLREGLDVVSRLLVETGESPTTNY